MSGRHALGGPAASIPAAPAAAKRAGKKAQRPRLPSALRTTLSLTLAAILWEIVARLLVKNALLFPSLSEIFQAGVKLVNAGELQEHIWVSGIEFLAGYFLSAVVGILLGLFISSARWAQDLFEPWINLLYAMPVIALGPLFILWMGIGVESKIAIIFLTAVFPILINTMIGVANADANLVDVTRSFGATKPQIYAKVRFPSAVHYIFAGLRISIARALVAVVVAEMFGARAGLGFLILSSAQSFDTPGLYVGVLVLALAGVSSVAFLKWLERVLVPWKAPDDKP